MKVYNLKCITSFSQALEPVIDTDAVTDRSLK